MLQRVYRRALNKAISVNQRSTRTVSAALFSRLQTRNINVSVSDKPQEAAADQPAVVYMYTEEDAARLSSVWTKAIATDFKGKAGEVLVHYPTEGSNLYQGSEAQGPQKPHRIVFVGLGKQSKVTLPSVRKAVAHAVDKLKALKVNAATLSVPNVGAINQGQQQQTALVDVLSTMANTSVLADYRFDKYMTREDNKSVPLTSLTLLAESLPPNAAQFVREAVVIGECTNYARDLANERAEVATPAYYEQQARQLQAEHATVLDIEVLQYEDLQQHGLNLIAAVGQGAPVLPRLVLLKYRGNPDSTEEIGLVGKGITFDTGGLNLKPTNSIEDMYMDNAGAAAVLGTMKAAAKLNLKINLRGVLALAENSIGPNAYRPGAIITSVGGPSVEIRNTDAEGRLALADALNWLQRKNSPQVIVDLATLTGACVMALGEYAAGLFSNSTTLTQQLQRAADLTGERVWPLPLFEEHSADLKGSQSDIKNIAVKGRGAGASSGAAFLKEFIKDGVEWAHLDIAGTGASSFKKSYVPQGGTGFGVHLLIEWLKTRV